MTAETFEAIWKQVEETAQTILRRLEPEGHNFRFSYLDEGKWAVRSEYERIRKDLKARCYEPPVSGEDDAHRIDHHKIAACLCKALVTKKMFSFRMDENISKEMLLSNYELAYTVSLRIVYNYMVESYKHKGDTEHMRTLLEWKCLQVPETTPSHDGYDLGRIKALALNDFYQVEFDLLAYADMMFWIEHYNRQILTDEVKVHFQPRSISETGRPQSPPGP